MGFTELFIGSLTISALHAFMPNHWLPIIAISKKFHWSSLTTLKVTTLCAAAHASSTILIGVILSIFGNTTFKYFEDISHVLGPIILILMGIYFLYRHHTHHHFHLDADNQDKRSIISAFVLAMFVSPCMEIEAYFLLAGSISYLSVFYIAISYLLITLLGMVLWVGIILKTTAHFNWHRLEHNAGLIAGIVLILTGLIPLVSHFIQH